MIKQFNFYDIYGYLIPGMLLVGILWVPVGIMMHSIPEQDLSKALFLGVLAYVVGHLLNTVSTTVVPSKVIDMQRRPRVVSELLLDKSDLQWSMDAKLRLQAQIQQVFGISLRVDLDGTGSDEVSKTRNAAFFQARSYLTLRKAAGYAEQFQGLYSMMRGLGCSLCVGTAYFLGWWVSSVAHSTCIRRILAVLTLVAVCGTFKFSFQKKLTSADKIMTILFWLLGFLGLGFMLGISSAAHFGHPLFPNAQRLLLAGMVMMLLASIKCFSAYRAFACSFAETVWRDFSACVSYGGAGSPAHATTPDGE